LENFLKQDNDSDVLPFVEAIKQLKDFHGNKHLELFCDDVSLPGLVLKYLINFTKDKLHLHDDGDDLIDDNKVRKGLFYLLKYSDR